MFDLIMIVGPTAVGKTRLSIEIAKTFDGEIINGDSMQFYKGLDIGTAKIKEAEKQGITHHLIDILEPSDNFSVAIYQKLVRAKIEDIKSRSKLPIIVGGSGLYLNSIINDYQFMGKERTIEKADIYQDLETEELAEILKREKPLLAKNTDLSNRRRVLRALEKNDSDVQDKLVPYYENILIIGLELDREILYKRINERVHKMIDLGLLSEVEALYKSQVNGQALQAIGYKELFPYFEDKISFIDAVELIKQNSRRYAKRQMTWFKNKMNVTWFKVEADNFSLTIDHIIEFIKKTINTNNYN